ncbi:MAG: carboxypeptidase regulatory-like domain-containing protein [Archangium sp.]|nr:carboxypeptidase regulatory-like domain-containing protein [Archangium sp.]
MVLTFPFSARAQTTVASSVRKPGWSDDKAQVRLHYGLAFRSGAETDSGPGLSYSGFSPNDLAFTGWVWLLLGDHLGLTAGLQREAFSLLDNGTNVTSGSLMRVNVGPTGRVRLGPVRLEAAASYTLQQLPVFGTVDTPAFSTVQRHGVLLAARGLVDLGPVTLEGRFEYPLGLANLGRTVSSRGLGVGGGLRVQLFRTGPLKWGVLAEALWHSDSMTTTDASTPLTTSQSVVRAGLALDLQWKDPKLEEEARTGSLKILVRGEQGPLAGVAVAVSGGPSRRDLVTGPDGTAIAELEPGELIAAASLAGYEAAESRVSLGVGDERSVELLLSREKPKSGGLSIKVVSFEGATPVAATIELDGRATPTSPAGALALEGLAPGPLSVKVTAPGFNPGEEAASIVAGRVSELTVTLVPEKKRVPATLRGQVRSARGGKPVVAQLEIRELKQTIAADEGGAFSVQIAGGKYTVRITATGFVTQTKTVTVRDGDQAIFNVDLAPK